MKNSAYQMKQLKYKVMSNKDPKKYWSLTREEIAYFEGLGCIVKPAIFNIRTRKLIDYKNAKSSLLKQLHHDYKRGKKSINKFLTEKDVAILKENDIKHFPIKYRVIPPYWMN